MISHLGFVFLNMDKPISKNLQIYNASAGSGKTFTLVSEYLKILFQAKSIYTFKNILAITFTNKAAAEMKSRILESLQEFAKPITTTKNNALFNKICTELALEPQDVQKKSDLIIKTILNNYAAFNITTIDSFTYKLIRSFAFDLGISLNFEVEMDSISLLNKTVDVLISRIGEDKSLTKTLIDFSISKSLEDKSWDISIDLKEIAKLLLNENDILQVNKIKEKSIKDFTDLQSNISQKLKAAEAEFKSIGEQGLELINDLQIDHKSFYYTQFPKHFINLTNLSAMNFSTEKGLGKSIESEVFYTKKQPQQVKDDIDSIVPNLLDLYYQSKKINSDYLLHKLIRNSLIPLAILRTINNVLIEIKEEKNVRLISEFNQIISKHLKEQPAAFIYEKIGERFHHYFIDEMQDTSTMQWENLIPLLDNVLSSQNEKEIAGSLLLVGDAKQAIYRWRGGKAKQFIALASKKGANPFVVAKDINLLDTNWRSYSEIINFNNSFFQHIAKYLQNEAYQELYTIGNTQKHNHKKGGYVEIQFVPENLSTKDKLVVYPEKILEIIKNIEGEFDKKDICILTRTRNQGVAVAEFLTNEKIDIISSESLLLKNSAKVSFIIDLLNYINQPKDKDTQFEMLYFLYNYNNIETDKHTYFKHYLALDESDFYTELEKLNIHFKYDYFKNLSLYESIEYIIRKFNLTTSSDAYLQFFLDLILDFALKKNEGIEGFLHFWEEKKHKLSIVVSNEKDAVTIMTIHKSKGLEFPVVIYPFDLDIYKEIKPKVWYEPLEKEQYNGFDSALINFNKSLQDISKVGAAIYNEQREQLELDNFNLLYVALTRAEEQLYIISEHKKETDSPKFYSHFFKDYLNNINKWSEATSVYKFGDVKRTSIKSKSKQNNIEQVTFISSDWRDHNIHITPKSLSEDDEIEEARKHGNLIHAILEKVNHHKEVDSTINSFINKGLFSLQDKENITTIIKTVVNHIQLKKYYSGNYLIMNEREILTGSGDIVIPDRLIFKNDEVIIIDYKTGNKEKKHIQQITNYAAILIKMKYKVVKKLLVYIDDTVTVLEVD